MILTKEQSRKYLEVTERQKDEWAYNILFPFVDKYVVEYEQQEEKQKQNRQEASNEADKNEA